ncbi:MAG: putative aromatic acid transporter [Sphingomonas bacterium]|jgi:AAHS family 4-hydroxybenzoate transporter-like MFS transporter|nr:putative aromatic acid transporter [Sphingomonas bacterium]MDB5716711.1 putative aromatic acid transporter [Sphingomonas bacterium]
MQKLADAKTTLAGAKAGDRGGRGFWLILIALVVEGYDLQAANFAAPAIVEAFDLSRAQVGPLLSASLVGVLFGALFVGPLGDRIGRRRILIGCCIAYGLLSLVAAAATNLPMLIVLRALIGVGLGGFLPNALALAGELAPPGQQSTRTALVGLGITLGGVLAGALAARLMPAYGWRSVFVAGGLLPLLVAAMLAIGLPDSPVLKPRASGAVRGGLLGGVRALLAPANRATSVAIWIIFAAVLMNVYLLSGWIPLLMTDSGLSIADAAWVGTAYHAGGLGGGIIASLILAHRGWRTVTLSASLAACVLLVLTAHNWSREAVILLIVTLGFFVTGTQNAINGAAGATYPAEIRAAGLGWALGLGRLGSIAGPLVGSLAIALGMSQPRQFFAIPILPLLIAAALAFWLGGRRASSATDIEERPA